MIQGGGMSNTLYNFYDECLFVKQILQSVMERVESLSTVALSQMKIYLDLLMHQGN